MLYLQTLLHCVHLQPTQFADLLLMLSSTCCTLHTLANPGTIGQCDKIGHDQGSKPAHDISMAAWQRHLSSSEEYILQYWSAIAVPSPFCQLATADITARRCQSETQWFAVRVCIADKQYLCEVDFLS